MSVWYCIPSAKPVPEAQACVNAWRAMGYKVALYRDAENSREPEIDADVVVYLEYDGYAKAVNMLANAILLRDPECEWIVTGGDDTIPDQTKRAEVIALECTQHFAGTFGVMQPTGDRWGADPAQPNFVGSAYIDRVAGSPWLGRAWCERAHGGQGPLHPDFAHMFVDEALRGAAVTLKCYWERPDLTHFHDHWARKQGQQMPGYIRPVNSPGHWRDSQAIFERVKRGGYAECLPSARE